MTTIEKVYKGSDLLIDLILRDNKGQIFRVSDVDEFNIRFYTTDPTIYIECIGTGTAKNIIAQHSRFDTAVLNSTDIEKLDEGLIKYQYHLKVKDLLLEDQIYDEDVIGETNLYLKSKTRYA